MGNVYFIHKAFRIYAINSVISNVSVTLSVFVDAIILGNALGETGLAVLSIATPIYMFYNLLSFAFGVGGSIKAAEFLGENRKEDACQIFTKTLSWAALFSLAASILGILFFEPILWVLGGTTLGQSAIDYVRPILLFAPFFIMTPIVGLMLRSDSDPKRSTAGILLAMITNLGLDILFLLVFDMGAFGAAAAMIIGQAASLLVYLPHFFKKYNNLRLQKISMHLKEMGAIFMGGFSSAASYIYQGVVMVLFNHLLLASLGPEGVAGYQVLFNVNLFTFAFFEGLSLALPALLATFKGERDHKSLELLMKLAFRTGLFFALAFVPLIVLCRRYIIYLFGISLLPGLETAVACYASLLIPCCLLCLLTCYYQAMGRFQLAISLRILADFLFLIPLGVVCIYRWGLLGVSLAQSAAQWGALLIVVAFAFRLQKKEGCTNILLLPKPSAQLAPIYEHTIAGGLEELSALNDDIATFCEEQEISPRITYLIQLSLEELVGNILAYGARTGTQLYVNIKIAKYDEDVYLRLRDDAVAYNPFEAVSGDDGTEEIQMEYMGVDMVKKLSKVYDYQRKISFNNLLIIL